MSLTLPRSVCACRITSWGEYWGEMGYIRVKFGTLHVEDQCAWATVKSFTAPEMSNQVHCYEGGENCQ